MAVSVTIFFNTYLVSTNYRSFHLRRLLDGWDPQLGKISYRKCNIMKDGKLDFMILQATTRIVERKFQTKVVQNWKIYNLISYKIIFSIWSIYCKNNCFCTFLLFKTLFCCDTPYLTKNWSYFRNYWKRQ